MSDPQEASRVWYWTKPRDLFAVEREYLIAWKPNDAPPDAKARKGDRYALKCFPDELWEWVQIVIAEGHCDPLSHNIAILTKQGSDWVQSHRTCWVRNGIYWDQPVKGWQAVEIIPIRIPVRSVEEALRFDQKKEQFKKAKVNHEQQRLF